jgi:FkbM family methyltransferase
MAQHDPGLLQQLFRKYVQAPNHPAKLTIERRLAGILLPAMGAPFPISRGLSLYLHPRDYIEYLLLKGEDYEAATLDFLRLNLKAGDRAAFAGVNFGLHVAYSSKLVGATGQIVGIEPQPRSLDRAWRNIKLNDCPSNIVLVEGGLGQSRGLLRFAEAPDHNTGAASFLADSKNRPFCAWIDTLPAIFSHLELKTPRLFLLDVEGFELQVLNGLSSDFPIAVIIVEVNKPVLTSHGFREGTFTSVYRSSVIP